MVQGGSKIRARHFIQNINWKRVQRFEGKAVFRLNGLATIWLVASLCVCVCVVVSIRYNLC
jgi:hypothetical protein